MSKSYVFNAQDVVNYINLCYRLNGKHPTGIYIPKDSFITPSAEELIKDRKLEIIWIDSDVVIGSDVDLLKLKKVEEQDGIQR